MEDFQESLEKDRVYYSLEEKIMNQKMIDMIEKIGNLELEEEEAEKIEEALSDKMLLEFKESLETFDETTLEGVEDIAVSKLIQIIVTLATAGTEEKEEEEGEVKKIKKYKPWSFALLPEED